MSTPTRTVPASRASWHAAEITDTRPETGSAARLTLQVDGWPGNLPGQHVDVRLTAPDGYTATRSYSLASSGDGASVVLAVDRLPDGEVSPYLVDVAQVGDRVEVRGPLGGYFVWRPPASGAAVRPVQLIAGGSGVVPLYSIVQAHADAADATPVRLLYSVRTPDDVFFADELDAATRGSGPFALDLVYTRRAPAGATRAAGRVTREVLRAAVIPPEQNPVIYVCGSTRFVETVASWLLDDGHDRRSIRTERYGGT
ncbi:oxidoreductase [Microbacterium mangrovi]|uniref:Oxidoreductase n=1 Tax=Microbacterium mangrovi TaxID=1348253 RepID=A0A0B1ZZ62_9MICO|nr:ferredoxin reductase [Microbacterium mangrovi]KHK96031.1 oxidoreductase [Microbacterium mangrovi]